MVTSRALTNFGRAVVAVAVCCAVVAPAASARPARPDVSCAATDPVLGHGRPLPWAQDLFSVLKSSKNTGPVPSAMKRAGCAAVLSRTTGGQPDVLDLHRAWKVRDPLDPHGLWIRIAPGRDGVLYNVGGGVSGYAKRCVLEAQRGTFFTHGSTLTGYFEAYGIVADDVTAVTATGGVGTRVGPDGQPLPADVTAVPVHNVFHLFAQNGVAQVTFVRGDKPPVVFSQVGGPSSLPTPAC